MDIYHTIIAVILCHLFGDYVLQNDFIAKTKGENPYHLFVHCALYCLPFLVVFGYTWQIIVVFLSHLCVDNAKARYGVISYTIDQVIHYYICLLYLFN